MFIRVARKRNQPKFWGCGRILQIKNQPLIFFNNPDAISRNRPAKYIVHLTKIMEKTIAGKNYSSNGTANRIEWPSREQTDSAWSIAVPAHLYIVIFPILTITVSEWYLLEVWPVHEKGIARYWKFLCYVKTSRSGNNIYQILCVKSLVHFSPPYLGSFTAVSSVILSTLI
jgi:hypothetical protein